MTPSRPANLATAALAAAALLAFAATAARAQESFPEEGWEEDRSPLASEFAEPGGRISMFASQFPKSFNYVIDNNVFSREVFRLMFEQLLTMDSVTLEDRPGLANRWEISEDRMAFTFHIDPRAEWSDGTPITAEDVVWSFEAVKNPEHLTGPYQITMSRLVGIEALDERTVRIQANEVHWRNLLAASSFPVLPKHWWETQEFNRVNFEFPVVSGPFELSEVREPVYVRLRKREDYWRADSPASEGLLNFDEIEYRFYAQRDTAFEAFRQGEVDLFAVYTASRWVRETEGERFDKNWIVKQSVHNYSPVGFQGFAMNMRRAPYDDVRVRRALAHLLDRERMNQTLMFNQYVLSASYWPDLWGETRPNPNEPLAFDVEKARALLAEAGWEVNPRTGKLEKGGQPFVINFLTRDPSSNRFLLVYEEALSDVGIELKIDQKDWAAWSRDMDEFNYDMTWAAWGAGTIKDPESMWDSASAELKSSNNITGLKNERIDELIASIKGEFDIEARHEVVRDIDQILFEETPYILLWHIDFARILYWNRFGMPDHVLGKYSEEWAAVDYWWADDFLEEDLKEARASGAALPPPPRDVYFDEVFSAPEALDTARAEPLQ